MISPDACEVLFLNPSLFFFFLIIQLDKGIQGEALDLQFKDFPTTLAYTVDVKPKMWLPVRLVEGRLCREIKTNLLSIRDTAQKVIEGVIHDL